ncbi:hypothetical protein [Pyrococcus kukulkanii]|nr:hypothetical protein [Pyrococcus kukulkanii]
MKEIIRKVSEEILRKYGSKLIMLIGFGSAFERDRPNDIDIVVVVKDSEPNSVIQEIENLITMLSEQNNIKIANNVVRLSEFLFDLLYNGNPIAFNALFKGTPIYGEDVFISLHKFAKLVYGSVITDETFKALISEELRDVKLGLTQCELLLQKLATKLYVAVTLTSQAWVLKNKGKIVFNVGQIEEELEDEELIEILKEAKKLKTSKTVSQEDIAKLLEKLENYLN